MTVYDPSERHDSYRSRLLLPDGVSADLLSEEMDGGLQHFHDAWNSAENTLYNPRSGNFVLLFVFYCIWEYIWKYPDTVSENRVDSGTGDGDNACTGHSTVIFDYGGCADGIVCGFLDGYTRYYAGV